MRCVDWRRYGGNEVCWRFLIEIHTLWTFHLFTLLKTSSRLLLTSIEQVFLSFVDDGTLRHLPRWLLMSSRSWHNGGAVVRAAWWGSVVIGSRQCVWITIQIGTVIGRRDGLEKEREKKIRHSMKYLHVEERKTVGDCRMDRLALLCEHEDLPVSMIDISVEHCCLIKPSWWGVHYIMRSQRLVIDVANHA